MEQFDLAVVGSGAGGDGVARPAASAGLRVALIERDKLGGECLNYGCDPTKAMYRSAEVAHLLRRAPEFGLQADNVRVDFSRVMARKDAIVQRIRGHDPFGGVRAAGIELFLGEGRFVSPHEIQIGDEVIRAEKVVIATGTSPAAPPIEGLAEVGYLTNVSAMDMTELPASLVVLGGGPIGCEFAQIFSRLGAEVTLVELLPQLISTEEQEIAFALERMLTEEGIRVFTGTAAASISRENGRKVIHAERNGRPLRFACDEILVAAGRRPNTDALNLEAAGIRTNGRGIEVDDELRTTAEHVWAAGDVTGKYLFTHVASYQAEVAFANAVQGEHRKADYRVVPWAIFTDPEVGHVGLTETQARDAGYQISAARFDFSDLDRAITMGEAHGAGKIVADAKTGQILGANYLAPHAGDMINELALAMHAQIPVWKVGETIHAYPTLPEGVRWTATNFRWD